MVRKRFANFLARLHFSLSYFCKKVYNKPIKLFPRSETFNMSTIYCFIGALPETVQNIRNSETQSQLDALKDWKSSIL